MSRAEAASKSDRALELFEKGVAASAIAERLGTSQNSIFAMVKSAKARREKNRRAPEMERADT